MKKTLYILTIYFVISSCSSKQTENKNVLQTVDSSANGQFKTDSLPELKEDLKTVDFEQYGYFDTPDSLMTIKLYYETLDSTAIKRKHPLNNIHFPNIVTYDENGDFKLAYCTTDKNKWISATLFPFENDIGYIPLTNNFNLINIDNKGQAEIVVKGQKESYGSGGGSGIQWLVILNIDSVPTQIFKVYYGCYDESFGKRDGNGEGAYYKEYKRKIEISKNGIIISHLNKKQLLLIETEYCNMLTKIASGTYILDKGRIRKINNTTTR